MSSYRWLEDDHKKWTKNERNPGAFASGNTSSLASCWRCLCRSGATCYDFSEKRGMGWRRPRLERLVPLGMGPKSAWWITSFLVHGSVASWRVSCLRLGLLCHALPASFQFSSPSRWYAIETENDRLANWYYSDYYNDYSITIVTIVAWYYLVL